MPIPADTQSSPLPQPRLAMAGRFLRGSLGSGVAVGARAAGALLLNKLLAVYGGPGGLTLLAHFQNLTGLFTTLPGDGVHVGLVKYLAPRQSTARRYRVWLGAGVVWNVVLVGVGALALVVAPAPLAGVFHPSSAWIAAFIVGIAMLTAHAFLVAVLLAAGRLRAYVWLTVALSSLGVGSVALCLARPGSVAVEWVLIGYLLAQGLTVVISYIVCYKLGLLPQLRGRVSRPALRGLGSFLLMALSVLVFGKAVDFVLRDILIVRFSLVKTDLWQAVAKLSDNYTMVFTAVMGSVYYPRLAALSAQPVALRAYVRTVLLILAPTLAAGLTAIYLLRDWLLPLLFEPHFAAARDLLGPQLLGDWAKFLTWTLLWLLTAQARVVQYVAVQGLAAVLYAALLAVLLPRYGLLGASLANAYHFCILLLLCAVYFRAYWLR